MIHILLLQQPVFSLTLQLAQAFIVIIGQQQGERFDDWLQQVESSHIKPLITFANRLKGDYDAVLAALSTPLSISIG